MKQEVSAADGVVSLVIKNALLIEENEKGFQNIRSYSLFSFIWGWGGGAAPSLVSVTGCLVSLVRQSGQGEVVTKRAIVAWLADRRKYR